MATPICIPSFLPPSSLLSQFHPKPHHHHHQSVCFQPTTARAACASLIEPKPIPTPSSPSPLLKPHDQNPHDHTFSAPERYHLLRLSIHHNDFSLAKAVHASILKSRQNTPLSNNLIKTYIKLGKITHAHDFLSTLSSPTVISYTSLIYAYAKGSNQEYEAVELFFDMRSAGIEPNEHAFVAILTACIRLLDTELGSQIHALTIKTGFCSFTYVSHALMGLYVKCGCMDDASQLFNEMTQRDLPLSISKISRLDNESDYQKAFESFRFRQKTPLTLITIPDPYQHLRLSIHNKDLSLAKAVHASILKSQPSTRLSNNLILTYIKLGNITHAHNVLSTLSSPNVFSYSPLISAYAKESNQEYGAVELFFDMRSAGIEPNEYVFVAILTACIRLLDSELGTQIHALAIKTGFCSFTYVSNALVGLYVKCGCVDDAIQLFNEMTQRDLASWTSLTSGLVNESDYEKAFEYFRYMQTSDGFRVDQLMLSTLMSAATGSFAWMTGREIHAHALRIGFWSNVSVNNSLIRFYSRCGSVEDVTGLFEKMPVKDVITWTTMVTGLMELGLVDRAVEFFEQMPEKNYVSYDTLFTGLYRNVEGARLLEMFQRMLENRLEISDFILTSVVNACGMLSEAEISKQIHAFVIKSGFGTNPWVEAALLDMCTRCKRTSDALKMFNQWPYAEDLSVVWTSMIGGYTRDGKPDEAVSFFCTIIAEGEVTIDELAATTVLGVCGTLGFHEMGMQIHSYAIKSGILVDLDVGNAVFSMYSKCGNLKDAVKCFDLMPKHDIVSWNGLITGYLIHRHGDKALDVWSKMGLIGIAPDSITFVLILMAYRHTSSDLVGACNDLFRSMKIIYNIQPTSAHYASIVGVLGYWGYYDEAEELISNMPFEPDAIVWRALLDSCRLRSRTRLGKQVAKRLLTMEPEDPSTYILVSNLYAASGRWQCSGRVREEMRERGLKKHPVRSWVIHENKVHSFYSRDKSHSQTKDIYSGLDILILECMKAGYTPDTSFVLQEVEEFQKKDFLFYHSAKLAATFGILTTGLGRPVRVVKNIQICGDCHTFLKYVSKVTRREISLRDSSGFHLFKNGECCCRDYW